MWVNWFLKGRNKEINDGFAPKNQVLRLKKTQKRTQSANIMQASSDSDFLPAKHVKLNRCWFRALSGTMNIISSNSYQKGRNWIKNPILQFCYKIYLQDQIILGEDTIFQKLMQNKFLSLV